MSGILLARRAAFHRGVALPAIGSAFYGGYYAGVIDTTKGNIIASDYYQTGSRFAVIVAGLSLEVASKTYFWQTTASPAQSGTLWNGLGATAAMATNAHYAAAYYCAGLTYNTTDGASSWYLPALDELELVWRNLKPITDNNYTTSTPATFPPYAQAPGVNVSSDPAGAAYTTTVPAQTTVAAFQSGGAQALNGNYWSATAGSTSGAWYQRMNTTQPGQQTTANKTTAISVRPIRRLVLA